MYYSRALIPTLREAPAEAEVVSHQLLMRAAMIRKVTSGIYEFLPTGLKALNKVRRIIEDELDKAGCQQVEMPHLIPAELWQESGRWQKYGKELLRLKDRHDREYCFGPTHEEVICDLVRNELRSYRDLPLNLYQIQTKFRDEIRPRFGLMRGREFLMKDGYSFHASYDDLDQEYQKMRAAYLRIFARCGLDAKVVEADTGAIGGMDSHEIVVLAETGEDVIASCQSCDYAANIERAVRRRPEGFKNFDVGALAEVATPGKKSIDEVSAFLKINPAQMIKSLVYFNGERLVMVCLAGDRDVNEIKLAKILGGSELRLAKDDEILAATGAPVGFLGPVKLPKKVDVLFDVSLLQMADGVTGANKADCHFTHVNFDRDLPQHNLGEMAVDFAFVRESDSCPRCQKGQLVLMRGIEVGHIFKLGTRYSEPMRVKYLDEGGQEKIAIMGTYGIGVTRVLAASVEQNNDDKGIIWPKGIAPYDIEIIPLGPEPELVQKAEELYQGLSALGLSVLLDDRGERAGVKLNDADLLGVPLQIVIGRKGLEAGNFETKIRRGMIKSTVPVSGGAEAIKKIWESIVR